MGNNPTSEPKKKEESKLPVQANQEELSYKEIYTTPVQIQQEYDYLPPEYVVLNSGRLRFVKGKQTHYTLDKEPILVTDHNINFVERVQGSVNYQSSFMLLKEDEETKESKNRYYLAGITNHWVDNTKPMRYIEIVHFKDLFSTIAANYNANKAMFVHCDCIFQVEDGEMRLSSQDCARLLWRPKSDNSEKLKGNVSDWKTLLMTSKRICEAFQDNGDIPTLSLNQIELVHQYTIYALFPIARYSLLMYCMRVPDKTDMSTEWMEGSFDLLTRFETKDDVERVKAFRELMSERIACSIA